MSKKGFKKIFKICENNHSTCDIILGFLENAFASRPGHMLAVGLNLQELQNYIPVPTGSMLQKYSSLPGELKLVELDCSTRNSGLGICVSGSRDGRRIVCVSEIRPEGAAAADGQISVGDELLEINGQILYGQSYQNAAAVINSTSSKVKIVLIRNKAALQHTATGSIMEAENHTITSPLDVDIKTDKEHKPDATGIQEERMRLDKPKPCPTKTQSPPVSFIASSNHNPLHDPTHFFSLISTSSHVPPTSHNATASHTHTIHHKQAYCRSMKSPSSSGLRSSSYCSACSMRSDPMTCPIIPGCINIIDICKGHSSLGLTIVGGCNTILGVILIHEVNEGGAAHRDGRLMAGDHILEVNGIDLRMASYEEALSVLRLSPQHVRLCVYRHTSAHTFPSQATHTHEDMWELFTVDLQLQSSQELGMSIVGKRNDTGIFVSEISQGGVVELDGRLSLGDQILSINGEDIRAVTQDYAHSLLQKCSGSVLLEVARFRATPHYPYECQNNLPGW
ncbi:multiple PDZ domain protein [Tachysurus ichikawai]